MERIIVMLGTRPEAIKLCPLIRELKKRGRWEVLVASTGQHRALLDSAMEAFDIKPDVDFDVMRAGQSLSAVHARIMRRTDELLQAEHPCAVLVHGDTVTAFASSLAAFYQRIPVGHVEAGLRTYHMDSPFPEEFHRTAIAHYASYHFAPTVTAKKNLVRQGVRESSIFITGNTVVDALRYTLTEKQPSCPQRFPDGARVMVVTAHRRESFGKPIAGIFRAVRRLVDAYPDIIAVCPLHHNPEVRRAAEALRGHPRICIIEPPETVTFHHLLSRAYLIITDSGGIQEEAVALGIPTIVTRFSTERSEGLRTGVLRLAGMGEDGITELGMRLLSYDSEEYTGMKKPSKIYGDGNASARIANALERVL